MTTLTFKAFIRKERFFVAECPELGLTATGLRPEHALACLKAETEEYLASLGNDPAAVLALLRTRSDYDGPRDRGVLTRRYTVELQDGLSDE
jgi:hypothetical protein